MLQSSLLDGVKVAVIADTDSRWKWVLATAKQLTTTPPDLYLRETAARPSERQLVEAGADPSRVRTVQLAELPVVLAENPCDVLIIGLPGSGVQAVLQAMAGQWTEPKRPILVSGYVGIIYERLVEGLYHRAGSDVIVANSPADARAFTGLLAAAGFDPSAVVTEPLPFLGSPASAAGADGVGALTFAAQPDVPATKADRNYIVTRLIEHARRHPEQPVLLKVRGVAKERLTHPEPHPYQRLVEARNDELPANFSVIAGPMSDALDRSAVLITMSSTAAVEAIHRGLPTGILTDLGIREEMGNHFFAGSGCYVSFDELADGARPLADPDWATDHGLAGLEPGALVARVGALLGSELPAPRPFFTAQRSAVYRKRLLAENGLDEAGRPVPVRHRGIGGRVLRRLARWIYRNGYGVVAPALRRLGA